MNFSKLREKRTGYLSAILDSFLLLRSVSKLIQRISITGVLYFAAIWHLASGIGREVVIGLHIRVREEIWKVCSNLGGFGGSNNDVISIAILASEEFARGNA